MENMKSAVYTYEDLEGKTRPELNRLAKKLKIKNMRGKNEEIIERMIDKTKTVRCIWDEDGELSAPDIVEERVNENGTRVHPVLGEWHEYVITSRDPDLMDETFANNHFSARIQMNKPVRLPEQFAEFIATACYTKEHYYDETQFNPETGKYGVHTSRDVPDFFVRKVG